MELTRVFEKLGKNDVGLAGGKGASLGEMNQAGISVPPGFVPLIKKASAIITDEGGVTCHAAIMAREFSVPCIIGTKFATSVLRDGDLVEVDADDGVVKILEKADEKNIDNRKNLEDEILNKNWMFLVSRPYTLFGASLYQRWFDPPQIMELFGISIPDNLYVEKHPNVVRRYVIREQNDSFTNSIRSIIINDREKCKKILEKGLILGKKANKYLKKSPFNNLSSAINFLVDLTLHATVFSYFSYPILKEINDKELLEMAEKLRSISYYPQIVENIINPLAKKEVGNDFNFMTFSEITTKDKSKIQQRKDANAKGKRFVYSNINKKESVEYFHNIEKIIERLEGIEISSSVKGQTAYPGKVKGRVRLILNSSINIEFNKGDILVAVTTNPILMPLIKRAGAIVTNEGGVTSHAAIISRELKIPCVIGTKFATHTFREGDIVEVDADKGIVKILKKAK